MPPSFDSEHDDLPFWDASRSLPVVALALVLVFLSSIVAALYPFQVLDPAWQVRLAIGLISGGPLPLLALGLLHLAHNLDSHNKPLKQRLRLWTTLAVGVCLGFALLVPLMVRDSLVAQGSAYDRQLADVKAKERAVASLRLAMANSTTAAELNQKFEKLQGPPLGPGDLALPLPMLKRLLEEKVFVASDKLIAEQRAALPQKLPLQALPDLISRSLAALALSLGFSALARRPNHSTSLLQEWQFSRDRRQMYRNASRRSSNQPTFGP